MDFGKTCFQEFEDEVAEVILTAKMNDGREVSISHFR